MFSENCISLLKRHGFVVDAHGVLYDVTMLNACGADMFINPGNYTDTEVQMVKDELIKMRNI